MTRNLLILLHRYVGLAIAGFLIMSGLTGAVISWDHELDDVLNPNLMRVHSLGSPISALTIASQVENRYPEIFVRTLPLHAEAGESLEVGVAPRVNERTGKLYEVDFNQVYVDPITGKELGKRNWGAVWPINKQTFVSFLYKFHYTLHLPMIWGIDLWGKWLLGSVAILWMLDCFIGFILTFPQKRRESKSRLIGNVRHKGDKKSWIRRWAPSWKIRLKSGRSKLNFDLHRAFSLWTWVLLFTLAFTGFSLNLYREIFHPIISTVSQTTPSPFDLRKPTPRDAPIIPTLDYTTVISKAQTEARRRGWDEPAGSAFYSPNYGVYGILFFNPEDGHGAGGVGHKVLFYDGVDGSYLGDRKPWHGTVADIFLQAQFPLHSGRILGLPGRILISIMGVVVAMLSITGIVIWWRKRRSRNDYKTNLVNS